MPQLFSFQISGLHNSYNLKNMFIEMAFWNQHDPEDLNIDIKTDVTND